MPPPSHTLRAFRKLPRHSGHTLQRLQSTSQPSALPPSFPTVYKCPPPSCPCAETPTGLDIDRKLPLFGTAPAYNRHVVICTGKDDWTSRIEDEEEPNIAKKLKSIVGPKGSLYHADRKTMVTNTSIAPAKSWPKGPMNVSAYLFPSFRYATTVSHTEDVHLAYLAGGIRPSSRLASWSTTSRKVKEIVVFICGHGTRDKRCGIMGPLLRSEFQRFLTEAGFRLPKPTSTVPLVELPSSAQILAEVLEPRVGPPHNAIVGLVSHVGGHLWAGNVILYIPPTFSTAEGLSPLAGKGIWYGRVEPKHVEGIVKETILGGRVIKEFFRGGINNNGKPLRL